MEWIKRVPSALVELLYPRNAVCMSCNTGAGFPREWLCEECRIELAKRWIGAGKPPEGGLFDGAAYAYYYSGPAGALVRSLKYRGIWKLSEFMGRDMARAFEAIQPTGADCLIPMPMHPKRLKKRGFNHAERLAGNAGEALGLPVVSALVRLRNTPQQARLNQEDRLKNLTGAMGLCEDVKGRRVILVDDVCTTGASANACAAVLLEGGAEAVYLLCYALARD